MTSHSCCPSLNSAPMQRLSAYLFHLPGTSYLYLPCTAIRSTINHLHPHSTLTLPLQSLRHARSYLFFEHSPCVLSPPSLYVGNPLSAFSSSPFVASRFRRFFHFMCNFRRLLTFCSVIVFQIDLVFVLPMDGPEVDVRQLLELFHVR